MLNKGHYVRMKMAPNTRLGTIEGTQVEGSRVRYLFRTDPRFYDPLADFYVLESVRKINELIKRGGG